MRKISEDASPAELIRTESATHPAILWISCHSEYELWRRAVWPRTRNKAPVPPPLLEW